MPPFIVVNQQPASVTLFTVRRRKMKSTRPVTTMTRKRVQVKGLLTRIKYSKLLRITEQYKPKTKAMKEKKNKAVTIFQFLLHEKNVLENPDQEIQKVAYYLHAYFGGVYTHNLNIAEQAFNEVMKSKTMEL